ncbi:uncharacterized protein PAC_17424 [Phialocephala subalpina]|uniref:2EXR domain-containing protein n=1 Tax=Phialocephala subalpina TaxID=576137 RepID=A0A1L7XR92_9HELO|nr:uncharacterized protein PAC_17424 [Phialocephala subalpina]
MDADAMQVYHGTMHDSTPLHAFDASSSFSTTPTTSTSSLTTPPSLSSPEPELAPNDKKHGILNEFTLFPLLPTELRLKIWSHALPPPKLHTISLPTCSCTLPYNTFSPSHQTLPIQQFPTTCPRQHVPRTLSSLPILLQVNRESRDEVLRRYVILGSDIGKGFKLAFDAKNDSVYFSNGRGPNRDFYSVQAKWPTSILPLSSIPGCLVSGFSARKRAEEMMKIRHLVIDEATLERQDYLLFPRQVLGLESITVLLMPWSSPLSSPVTSTFPSQPTTLVRTFGQETEGQAEGDVERRNDRDWGLKELRREFLEWIEEARKDLGLNRKPVVKVAQWGACLGGGEERFVGESMWRVVETGLWVHWEFNGREEGANAG